MTIHMDVPIRMTISQFSTAQDCAVVLEIQDYPQDANAVSSISI